VIFLDPGQIVRDLIDRRTVVQAPTDLTNVSVIFVRRFRNAAAAERRGARRRVYLKRSQAFVEQYLTTASRPVPFRSVTFHVVASSIVVQPPLIATRHPSPNAARGTRIDRFCMVGVCVRNPDPAMTTALRSGDIPEHWRRWPH
jgi:hypothetical protein